MLKACKHFTLMIYALFFLFSVTIFVCVTKNAYAATIATMSSISINKEGDNFSYWNQDATSFKKLKEYVKDVTNKESANFIPIEDRIVVSDMDGTFYGEQGPIYSEWMIYFHRILNDRDYHPSEAEISYAKQCVKAAQEGKISATMDTGEDAAQSKAFEGMSEEDFNAYVHNFMIKTPLDGFTNCTFAQAFYLPMLEIFSYLQANDFSIFVVTGTDRQLVRQCIKDAKINIPPYNIIGSDSNFIAEDQAFTNGMDYEWDKEDKVIRGAFLGTNNKANKVSNIVREIGKQPVLCFGNSTSDGSMMIYTLSNKNKYKSMSFGVLCDDDIREWGSDEKAKKMKTFCEKNGVVGISMKNDWKTIYGEEVKKKQLRDFFKE